MRNNKNYMENEPNSKEMGIVRTVEASSLVPQSEISEISIVSYQDRSKEYNSILDDLDKRSKEQDMIKEANLEGLVLGIEETIKSYPFTDTQKEILRSYVEKKGQIDEKWNQYWTASQGEDNSTNAGPIRTNAGAARAFSTLFGFPGGAVIGTGIAVLTAAGSATIPIVGICALGGVIGSYYLIKRSERKAYKLVQKQLRVETIQRLNTEDR